MPQSQSDEKRWGWVKINERNLNRTQSEFLRPIFLKPSGFGTSLLLRQLNRLSVKLMGSLRNLLGPHHRSEELLSVRPHSFEGERNWVWGYSFVPFGLDGVRFIYVR